MRAIQPRADAAPAKAGFDAPRDARPGRGTTSYHAADPQVIRLSVSAVVWRQGGAGRELLLMQRSDNGHWGIPGGYVEPGENVEQAVVRIHRAFGS